MRIKVWKPRNGETTIEVSDRRGLTGHFARQSGVAIEDAAATLDTMLAVYDAKKSAVLAGIATARALG